MARTSLSDSEAVPLVSPTDESHPPVCSRSSWTRHRHYSIIIWNIASVLALGVISYILWLFLASIEEGDASPAPPGSATDIIAHTRNGSYCGLYIKGYEQHLWLGMPYALPPVAELRFRRSQPLNTTWQDVRNATEYGPHCPAYGTHEAPFPKSEDCLTINVIRPVTGSSPDHRPSLLLPVGVFIHGGMNHGGGSSDPRYNLSHIARAGARAGLPFIAVSLNYRSSMWGFVHNRQVLGAGVANLGLHDQRTALWWVRENIRGFGGDPDRVTIWGGSSGADDVGFHLLAYGGRDEGLFRAAIMQSGSAVTTTANSVDGLQRMYDELVVQAGCGETEDGLDCLRTLSFDELYAVFTDNNDGASPQMMAFSVVSVDGDFVRTYSSLALREGRMVKVPILTGVTSNEGSTWISHNVSDWEGGYKAMSLAAIGGGKCRSSVRDNVSLRTAVCRSALEGVGDDNDDDVLSPPLGSLTSKAAFRRIEALEGDLHMNAADRLQCEAYADSGAGCYSYRFDARMPTPDQDPRLGVTHAAEIGPVLQNEVGGGFVVNPYSGFNDNDGFREMARTMGMMWAGFIVALDPNAGFVGRDEKVRGVGGKGVANWPLFSRERRERMVFGSAGVWVDKDFARLEAMEYINRIQAGILLQ